MSVLNIIKEEVNNSLTKNGYLISSVKLNTVCKHIYTNSLEKKFFEPFDCINTIIPLLLKGEKQLQDLDIFIRGIIFNCKMKELNMLVNKYQTKLLPIGVEDGYYILPDTMNI